MSTAVQTKESVQEYYGRTLASNEDLKTSACCSIDAMPTHLQPLLKTIHDEVHAKFYGCGSPIPLALEGQTVLDLGCGTGRDSYLLSQLVGPKGMVIGVDMTDEQVSDIIQGTWKVREDRYSEERTTMSEPRSKVEMYHIGG